MASENVFLLYAVLMGIFITFVYDLLRIFRRVIPHNRFWVSIEDIAFWFFCAIEVFLLLYRESNGTLRWFAVLGALTGMITYKKTISVFFVKHTSHILKTILKFLWKPFSIVGNAIGRGSKKAAKKISYKRKSIFRFIKKKLTLFIKTLKMVLCKQ